MILFKSIIHLDQFYLQIQTDGLIVMDCLEPSTDSNSGCTFTFHDVLVGPVLLESLLDVIEGVDIKSIQIEIKAFLE